MKGLWRLIALFWLLQACSNPQQVIRIKGSDTEVNLAVNLAEKFYSIRPDYTVSISGGGSGLGIASLLKRQADIANSSRPLTDEEVDLFKKTGTVLHTVIFAEDATAFIVNSSFPLDTLDVETLTRVLNGKLEAWTPLTGQTLPVTIYGRQSSSGTHAFIKKKLGIEFSDKAKEMNGSAQIVESVKQDVSGIGYVGAGYLTGMSAGIKVLRIAATPGTTAVSPLDQPAIRRRAYFFQRPLYQFIPDDSWEKIQPFLQFENGSAGKALIEKEGYYVLPQ